MTLTGRGIVITGASEGLGFAVARGCVEQGASVVLCARRAGPLEKAHQELVAIARKGQTVVARTCDVSVASQVEQVIQFAADVLPRFSGIVNNAGVYGPIGLLEDVDLESWMAALRINLLGTVLPCRYAVPLFRRWQRGKIVNVSGGGATAPLPRFSGYAASKAAVVRFTETLAEETRGSGIDVNAVAPGALNTRLLEEVLRAGAAAAGREFYARALKQKEDGGTPLEKAVALCMYLLSEESDGITGRLISAVWDPWATLQQRREALDRSDIYTLRRIVPRDRGLDWDRESARTAEPATPPDSPTSLSAGVRVEP